MELAKRKYTTDEIAQLRRAGKPKPEDCSWNAWKAPFSLDPLHEMMCWMMATGKSRKAIAAETGMSYVRVNEIIRSEIAQFRIKEMQWQIFGSNHQKRFESMIGQAIDTTSEVMQDSNTRASTRLSAANMIMDRALGKPKQQVELRSSELSDLYERLDELVGTGGRYGSGVQDIEDVEYVEVTKEEALQSGGTSEIDQVDDIIGELYDEEETSTEKDTTETENTEHKF